MAALTGKGFVVQAKKAWKDYASGLDTATKSAGNTGKAVKDTAKAVKDLANYTLGIDELNVIQPNTDNGSGSGSGGSGGTGGGGSNNEPAISDMFETIEVPNSMKDLAKMFEDSVAKSDFTKIGRMLNMKLCDALESIDWHDLTFDASTGEYKATVPAPQKSSYSQSGHKYGGSVVATDDAGNSTTITQSDATFGANLLLRVLEKVAPTLAFTYPTADAYITNATPVIKFKVTDNDSGVNPDTIVIKVDGAKVTTAFTKTAVTGGYECSYTPGTALADGAHTISIEASDFDGNAATAKTVTFTIDTIPPTLTLENPVDGLITNKAALVVSGKTDDVTSKPVTVTVNGTSVTVNSDGSFSKEITLVNGSNTITVVATDKAGKTTTVTRKVTLDTGAPVFEKVTLTHNPVDCGKTFVISVKVTD